MKGSEFERAGVSSYVGRGGFDLAFHLASRPSPENCQKHPVQTALANPFSIPLFSSSPRTGYTSFSCFFEAGLGCVFVFSRILNHTAGIICSVMFDGSFRLLAKVSVRVSIRNRASGFPLLHAFYSPTSALGCVAGIETLAGRVREQAFPGSFRKSV